MWTPTHVLVTVTKAKNLLEKGRGGNDAYCIIGLGKEKFLTSVKQKTLNPIWDEQAEFNLGEREDLKVTVYHKSSIIDEFIGRAVINISDMAHENTNTHIQWCKLMSKPDKENKKAEKERGEIEVRVDFLVKPKSGSVLDLSKTKEKSMSLKNLKDKSLNIKHSIGDKFKSLKRKNSKFAGENQFSLAEQSKRMGGSKLDFLEGEDVASLASSYSSINGPTLTRFGETKKMTSTNRYSPHSSMISETSSYNQDIDAAPPLSSRSTSIAGQNNMNNNASLLNQSIDETHETNHKRTISELSIETNIVKPQQEQHIFTSSTTSLRSQQPQSASTPTITRSQQPKVDDYNNNYVNNMKTLNEQEPAEPLNNNLTKLHSSDSFASVFQASMNSNDKLPPLPNNSKSSTYSSPALTNNSKSPYNTTNSSSSSQSSKHQQQQQHQQAPKISYNTSPTNSNSKISMKKLDNSFNTMNNEEDEIDWASSDEEIVKQEIETFERNQVLRQSERRKLVPTEDLTSDLNSDTDFTEKTNSNRSKQSRRNQLQINFQNNNNNLQQKKVAPLPPQSNDFQKQNKSVPKQESEDDIKTPDIDLDFYFEDLNAKSNVDSVKQSGNVSINRNDLPDIINQKSNNELSSPSDKARKFLEGLDGVKLSEISVPDSLRKQLEYFDREELLQLIAYQKKFLDDKESRIKDLDYYIDNLVVRVIEVQPSILMQAGFLSRNKN